MSDETNTWTRFAKSLGASASPWQGKRIEREATNPEAGKTLAYYVEQMEDLGDEMEAVQSKLDDLLTEMRDVAAEWNGDPVYESSFLRLHPSLPSFTGKITFGDYTGEHDPAGKHQVFSRTVKIGEENEG